MRIWTGGLRWPIPARRRCCRPSSRAGRWRGRAPHQGAATCPSSRRSAGQAHPGRVWDPAAGAAARGCDGLHREGGAAARAGAPRTWPLGRDVAAETGDHLLYLATLCQRQPSCIRQAIDAQHNVHSSMPFWNVSSTHVSSTHSGQFPPSWGRLLISLVSSASQPSKGGAVLDM